MWLETKKKRLQQQIDFYEERLQCLTEDYGALSRQISFESNAKAKNDLHRHLAAVAKDIERAEQEQSQLHAKLQSLEFEPPPSPLPPSLPRAPRAVFSRLIVPHSDNPFSLIRAPHKLSTYLPAFGTTVLLVVLWGYLKSRGNSVVDETSILPDEIRQKLGLYGGGGALITVLLWHVTAFSQQAARLNFRTLLVRCGVGAIAGFIAWYLPERLIHNTYNPALYGEGATYSAGFCLLASLLMLWIPLVFRSNSD
jgi:hypothetical protein